MQNKTFSTLFIAQNLIQLSAVDSTNNYLKLMVSNSEPVAEGTVIMAEDQFAGRGQQGNTWISKSGLDLTISIYLEPTFIPVEQQFLLNIAVSVGIWNALSYYVGEGLRVKWPNDIYHHDKKIGGVLIENTLSGNKFKSSIIGIGINVNRREFDDFTQNMASSLGRILHQHVDLMGLMERICHSIEVQYLKLRSGDNRILLDNYLQNLYLFKIESHYKVSGECFVGEIIGVSSAGQLILLVEGKERTYGFKEIEFLNKK